MYSRFRPYRRELEDKGRRVRGPPKDPKFDESGNGEGSQLRKAKAREAPGSQTYPGTASDRYQGETVRQTLNLEGHEWFTQLVAQTNLVKIGPRNGLFTSFVEVEENVIRVWRDWLRKMAARSGSAVPEREVIEEVEVGKGKGKEAVCEEATWSESRSLDDDGIQWLSSKNHTGIRFNVTERKLRRDAPILVGADEDMPVSYEVEYDGTSRHAHN